MDLSCFTYDSSHLPLMVKSESASATETTTETTSLQTYKHLFKIIIDSVMWQKPFYPDAFLDDGLTVYEASFLFIKNMVSKHNVPELCMLTLLTLCFELYREFPHIQDDTLLCKMVDAVNEADLIPRLRKRHVKKTIETLFKLHHIEYRKRDITRVLNRLDQSKTKAMLFDILSTTSSAYLPSASTPGPN